MCKADCAQGLEHYIHWDCSCTQYCWQIAFLWLGRTQEWHKVEKTGNFLPISATQGPCPPEPYQVLQKGTFDFEKTTKSLTEGQEPCSSPFRRMGFQTVSHRSFAIPEQWSQCGVCSLLYELVHMGQTGRHCILGWFGNLLHQFTPMCSHKDLKRGNGKQKLRKPDEINFALPPLP